MDIRKNLFPERTVRQRSKFPSRAVVVPSLEVLMTRLDEALGILVGPQSRLCLGLQTGLGTS